MKLLILTDDIRISSGMGNQIRQLSFELASLGYDIHIIGGAINHSSYQPIALSKNITIYPVKGYGDYHSISVIFHNIKPDRFIAFADPRFLEHLFAMDSTIRQKCPFIYYHIWDNLPYPTFNEVFYESTDYIVAFTRFTYHLLQDRWKSKLSYIGPGIDTSTFYPMSTAKRQQLKKSFFTPDRVPRQPEFTIFWNGRNIARKRPLTMLKAFNIFANTVCKNSCLIMHTDPLGQEGVNLDGAIRWLITDSNVVILSTQQGQPTAYLNDLYNLSDVVVNNSCAEGFGLSVLEGLATKTPVVATMTGGMVEQMYDFDQTEYYWQSKIEKSSTPEVSINYPMQRSWGWPIHPDYINFTGLGNVLGINEDLVSEKLLVQWLTDRYNTPISMIHEYCNRGYDHVAQNFTLSKMAKSWDSFLSNLEWTPPKPYSITTI